MKELDLCPIPVISTAHITNYANDCLKYAHYARDWFGYGWIIKTLEFMDEATDDPKSIKDVVEWAYLKGYAYLILDRDGEVRDDLPTHDW